MNTEPEDFDDQIPQDLGPPRGLKSSRRALNSPALRIGLAVIVVVIVAVGALALWSGDQKKLPQSSLPPTSGVKGLAGEEGASPAYVVAVQTKNSERLQEALETGGSAFPTPVAQPQLPKEATEESVDLDPVIAFTQTINQSPPPTETPVATPAVPAPPQGITPITQTYGYQQQVRDPNALAAAMQQQMQTLIAGWAPQPSVVFSIAGSPDLMAGQVQGYNPPSTSGNNALNEAQDQGSTLLVPAGAKIYAQMEMEANSDIPGPVIARILSGPLSGGRALGTFQSTNRHLIIEFNLITRGDKEYPIQAVAIDPNTQLTGLVTDSDQRYLERIALPGAAAFIRGFAQAYADVGSDVTTEDGVVTESRREQTIREQVAQGVEETADVVANIFQQEASQIRPLVVVGNGTPIALLFLRAVREETTP